MFFQAHFKVCLFHAARGSGPPDSDLESQNVGSDFQTSSTSLNQTHMSVGVLFRGGKHSAKYWTLLRTVLRSIAGVTKTSLIMMHQFMCVVYLVLRDFSTWQRSTVWVAISFKTPPRRNIVSYLYNVSCLRTQTSRVEALIYKQTKLS